MILQIKFNLFCNFATFDNTFALLTIFTLYWAGIPYIHTYTRARTSTTDNN